MKMDLRNLALWVLVVFLLLALFTYLQEPGPRVSAVDITYSQFISEVDQGRVRGVSIRGNEIIGNYTDGRRFLTYSPGDPALIQRLTSKGVSISARPADADQPWFISLLLSWAPFILLIGVWIFLSRRMRSPGGTIIGGPTGPRAANDEIDALKRQVADLQRQIDDLRNRSR